MWNCTTNSVPLPSRHYDNTYFSLEKMEKEDTGLMITKENIFVRKTETNHCVWKEYTICLVPLSKTVHLSTWMKSLGFRDLENNLILQVFFNVGHLRMQQGKKLSHFKYCWRFLCATIVKLCRLMLLPYVCVTQLKNLEHFLHFIKSFKFFFFLEHCSGS